MKVFLYVLMILLVIAIWEYSDCIINAKKIDWKVTMFCLIAMVLESLLIGFWFEVRWSAHSSNIQIGGGLLGSLILGMSMLLSMLIAIWKDEFNHHKR